MRHKVAGATSHCQVQALRARDLLGETVADCAQDVRAIAVGLEIERLAVWEISATPRC
jgi:hypothetical protein